MVPISRTNASSPPGLGSAGRRILPIAVIVGVCFIAYAPVLDFWFTGVDILPLILSNRLRSFADLPHIFTREYLAAYSDQEIAGSVGIRPTGQALFALDYFLWQLRPMGYHLTNLALHACNAVMVWVLAQELRLRNARLVALLAALLFAIHPLHSTSVPLQTDRFDILLGTFSLAFLTAMLRHLRTASRAALTSTLVFWLLALLTKESAIVLLPTALFTGVILFARGAIPARRAALLSVAMLAVLVVYLVYRSLVLGAVGGYPFHRLELFDRAQLMTRQFFRMLIYPVPFLDRTSAGPVIAAQLPLVFGLSLAACCIVGIWVAVRRRGEDQALFPLWLLSCWVLGYYPMYLAMKLLTGVFKPLYMYTAVALWCIALSGLVVGAAGTAWRWRHRRAAWLMPAAALAAGTALALSFLAGAPMRRGFDQWGTASRFAREYLDAFGASLPRVPDGSTVFLDTTANGQLATQGNIAIINKDGILVYQKKRQLNGGKPKE